MLEKHGGNLAAAGAVAWMFTKKGYIVVEKSKAEEEKLMNAVLEAGADDFQDDDDNWEVLTTPDVFQPSTKPSRRSASSPQPRRFR
jgi:transcriptional/translational regulatory protein YebC/TACO1